MTIPSNPTLDELIDEGLIQAGQRSSTAAHKARVKSEWFKDMKNDLWRMLDRPKVLQVTSHAILPKGQSRFSNPSDFAGDLNLTLLEGQVTGTALGGSNSSIDFAANTQGGEDNFLGKQILIVSGVGQASLSQCIGYDQTLKRASVSPAFRVPPGAGSTYLVITNEVPLDQHPADQYEREKDLDLGVPQFVYPFGDEDFGEFFLDCPVDKIYGARLRYYANIERIDIDSTWMSTLYQKWRNVWLKGIVWKDKKENHNDEWKDDYQLYVNEINELKGKQYGLEMHNLQQTVPDYC